MVRPLLVQKGDHFWSIPLGAIGLFVSATILVALCAKHGRKVSRNHQLTNNGDSKVAPKPSMAPTNKLMTSMGGKGVPFINTKKSCHKECEGINKSRTHERFGEGGLWQKEILMGEKCQPPVFSGVIHYDSRGNRISELPRSPRTPRP